jgi:galactitol-specific phosphotransferase system IIC component
MDRAPQMPPPDAPPGAVPKDGGSRGRRALIGALIGLAVGILAHEYDASPWWWLAVPAGMLLAVTTFHFQMNISWGRK